MVKLTFVSPSRKRLTMPVRLHALAEFIKPFKDSTDCRLKNSYLLTLKNVNGVPLGEWCYSDLHDIPFLLMDSPLLRREGTLVQPASE
ncbi:hypothetical protein RRG08_027643 [Elysia crispata]|uniref:Uncharacterized protein n=1 Tax=Elysia crispata TaxID=231223 RepID=A0AAE0XM39_9GAST|nr:hypothetical protein RRG08_027643 [Elysia crispata]